MSGPDLDAVSERPADRSFGVVELAVPPEFFEPLEDAELDAWE